MDLKNNTLEKVREALDALGEAGDDMFLTFSERNKLEAAAIQLRNLERSLIMAKEMELIHALTNDSKALRKLVAEIKESTARLAKLSEILEKASKGVEALIQILITATSAGIL